MIDELTSARGIVIWAEGDRREETQKT